MSVRNKRKRSRAELLDDNQINQLTAMGFNTQQIDAIKNNIDKDDPFVSALALLIETNEQNEEKEPPQKKRKLMQENGENTNNKNDNEENKNDDSKKKTLVQLREEEFEKDKVKFDKLENEYNEWSVNQNKVTQSLSNMRDHISNLYDRRPQIPDTSNQPKTIENLTFEVAQLKEIIIWSFCSMKNHLNFCTEKLDESYLATQIKEQEIATKRRKYSNMKDEFESEKYALTLLQEQVKSGINKMTLKEHNLFIIANAQNSNTNIVQSDEFKTLNNKIKTLQNETDEKKDKHIEFDCEICFTPIEKLEEILIFDECYHFYCMQCLKYTLKVKIEDRNIKEIKCPTAKCEHILNHVEIGYILSKDEFEKYDKYLTDNTLILAKDCCFCPRADCGTAMFGYSDSPMLTCPKCKKQFCFNCGTEEWHKGVTCDAFAKWKQENGKGDAKFAEWVQKQDAKPCPQCKAIIQKVDGCNWIKCASCQTGMCWQTGLVAGKGEGECGGGHSCHF